MKRSIFIALLLTGVFITARHAMAAKQLTPAKVAYTDCEANGKGWMQPGGTKKRGSLSWQQGAGHNSSTALVVKSVKAHNYFYNTTEVKLKSRALELTLWAKGNGGLKVHQLLYSAKKPSKPSGR